MIALDLEKDEGDLKSLSPIKAAGAKFVARLGWIASLISLHRTQHSLHLCEMLSLGDKRFVAVIEYGSKRFLLAGTPQNISLLHQLDAKTEARRESLHPVPHAE